MKRDSGPWLRRKDLHLRPSGHEPDELLLLHSAIWMLLSLNPRLTLCGKAASASSLGVFKEEVLSKPAVAYNYMITFTTASRPIFSQVLLRRYPGPVLAYPTPVTPRLV